MRTFKKKDLLLESGIRDINKIAQRYQKAKIYFHQDLDGVTSAIAMKKYLENNDIKVVDAEVIQYGGDEWAVKKPDASGNIMPVLVDFAHGKPMFVIHTDHHDTQSGVEKDTSTSFRHARSNVETISGIISPTDLFTPLDVKIISTVDSANFRALGISVKEVMNYIFKVDKTLGAEKNNIVMGLVTNKIVLAFKSKKIKSGENILEKLVLVCEPSLKNIYNTLIRLIIEEGTMKEMVKILKNELESELDTPAKIQKIQQQLQKHGEDYIEQIRGKEGQLIKYEDGIIIKDGGGSMSKTGSYDRYVAFELYPDADFQVVTWGSVGLLQVSCNPYKESRGLKGIDLGEINKGIIDNHKGELSDIKITAARLKKVAESSKRFVPYESVGFTLKDLVSFYGNTLEGYNEIPRKFENFLSKKYPDYEKGLREWKKIVSKTMDKPFIDLSEFELSVLDSIYTTAYDVIKNNSGGHKCITNFQASALGGGFGPYKTTEFINKIKDEFIEILRGKIMAEKKEKVDENYFKNVVKRVLR